MKMFQILLLVGLSIALPKKYNADKDYFLKKFYNALDSNESYKGMAYLQRLPMFRIRKRKPITQKRVYIQESDAPIDVEKYVKEVLNTPFSTDSRIKASTNKSSPSAAAALTYMKKVSKDGLCGRPTEIYLENILKGNTKEVANAEATREYITNYNKGERLESSGACAAADKAYREAWKNGEDPVLKSALAFMKNWPGAEEGNPCAVSGIEYVKAILSGKSHLEANRISTSSFANAFKDLARQGKELKDPACRDATKAFFKAISSKPDPANAAALSAFMDKIFQDGAPAFDPVCLASLEGFLDAYASGEDLLTSNLISARSFFRAFVAGSDIPADSPCAAATIAYAEEMKNKPSQANSAAMLAYITEAITHKRKIDPVCGAATLAYWDAYIENKSEAAASKAAGIAYLETLDKHPEFDQTSACAKSAEAYIAEFQ